MNLRLLPLIAIFTALPLQAAEQMSAMTACQALSKTQQRAVARLVAHAGKPSPETWTIVVHDPKAPKGLRECTVSSATVVSSRTTSDLATKLTSGDVVGVENLKIDSDQAADLAAAYAAANQLQPAAFDYELHKEGQAAAPLWSVTAFDEAGAKLGTVVVAANTGKVVSHDGFQQAPETPDLTADVAPTAAPATQDAKSTDSSNAKSSDSSTATKKRASNSSSDSPAQSVPRTFKRIGGHLEKFFTGKNTIGQ
jgi:hypothetical protein